MTWFKVDDSFHSHPKSMAIELAAIGLWTVAGSWSGANLTDGFVPDHVVQRLSMGQSTLAQALVDAGLWRRAKGGYRFHDWDSYQPSRESVLERRKVWRDKKADQRGKSGNRRSGGKLSPGDTLGESPGDSNESPTRVPLSRPVPESSNEDSPEKPRKRGTRIPKDFAVTAAMVAWARERVPRVDGRTETEKFINHFTAAPGQRGVKLDWIATWRNWMLSANERLEARGSTQGPSGNRRMDKALAALAPGDPMLDQFTSGNGHLMVIEGGQPA
jgi:hypothetical protein